MKGIVTKIITPLLFSAVTFAQWSSDPAFPQLLGSGIQAQVAATSDGGVYIAWLSDGNYHVYVQRIDAAGEVQLNESGMLVSDNNNSSWIAVYHLNLAVDSDDNAIITTVDQRTGIWEVYAWKIAPDGSMLWGEDGVVVTAFGASNMSPRLTVLSDNSVAVTCTHDNNTVLFQCISSDGTLLWGDGILIDDVAASLVSPQPTITVEGDVLIQWIRQTGSPPYYDSELFLQKYGLDGDPQWSEPKVVAGPVVFPMGNWSQQLVVEAGGGSFSAWTQFSGNVQNAVAQHISEDGELSWVGGVDLSTNSSNFRISPMLAVADETQELMAVWREANGSQSQHGVFAQRLDSSGNRLWGSTGTTVVALNSSYDYLDLSVAGFGEEMISAYIQQSNNMNGDIYANRLDADGNSVWTGGTVTMTTSGSPKSDMMTGKGSNCLFIAWSENGSVYAHCLREDGTLGPPDVGGGPGDILLVPSEYATIQDAINASENRDTVLVAPGTYVENINYSGKNIVVGSYFLMYGLTYFIEQTIIDGNQNGSVVTIDNGVDSTAVLSGFTITGGNSYDGGGVYCSSSSPIIANNIIIGNVSETYGGGISCNYSAAIIIDNLIRLNSSSYGGGISFDRYTSSVITGNNITNNNAEEGGGIGCFVFSSPSITNNTISENSADTKGGGIYCYYNSSATITNTIIWDNTASLGSDIYVYFSDPSINYCDVMGGWDGEGNINADPLFCNPDSGDYTLAANSPCVGTGEYGVTMGAFGVGCGTILSVDDNIIPQKFALYQNYPNPFNPVTTLRYNLPEDALISITIYDMMGRQIKTLINSMQAAGYRSTQWNATNDAGSPMSAGIYLYMIQAGEFGQTKKMVLLK